MSPIRRLCVYAGARTGADPAHREAAIRLGALLAARGITLVYGGGAVGLMGVIADAVLDRGGEVIGVIPEALMARELAHRRVTEMRVVGSMHERKACMSDLSDAFIALPGGLGTLDELFEALTWSQLRIHRKRCGLLNVNGYWDHLLAQIDRAGAEGFVGEGLREILLVERDPEALLALLDASG